MLQPITIPTQFQHDKGNLFASSHDRAFVECLNATQRPGSVTAEAWCARCCCCCCWPAGWPPPCASLVLRSTRLRRCAARALRWHIPMHFKRRPYSIITRRDSNQSNSNQFKFKSLTTGTRAPPTPCAATSTIWTATATPPRRTCSCSRATSCESPDCGLCGLYWTVDLRGRRGAALEWEEGEGRRLRRGRSAARRAQALPSSTQIQNALKFKFKFKRIQIQKQSL